MKAPAKPVLHQLAIARGQLEGIARMVEEDAYCLDISNQLLATIALLKKLNITVLEAHLEHCVKNASEAEKDEKIKEITAILSRLS